MPVVYPIVRLSEEEITIGNKSQLVILAKSNLVLLITVPLSNTYKYANLGDLLQLISFKIVAYPDYDSNPKKMKDITKKYSNGEVTIVWKPHICIHSGNCFRGLPQVFDPGRHPWITTDTATTKEIIEQVNKCPSGALSFYMNNDTNNANRIPGGK